MWDEISQCPWPTSARNCKASKEKARKVPMVASQYGQVLLIGCIPSK